MAQLAEGRRLLREELGLDPSPELRDLERRILEHDPRLRPSGAPRIVGAVRSGLHGREAELGLVSQVLAAAGDGDGSVLLVTGDAGIGKTSLLDELGRVVAAAGGVVRRATCRDGGAAPPFWPVLQMVRGAAAHLDAPTQQRLARALGPLRDMVPEVAADAGSPPGMSAGGVDPAMVLVHLSDALQLTLMPRAGAPALVVVDDVHAADPATLQLLGGLAADVHRRPVLLALAVRSGDAPSYSPLNSCLAALGRVPRLLRLDLEPLPDGSILDLVRSDMRADLAEEALADVVRRAEGNPFFALELARAAVAEKGRTDPVPSGRGRAVGGVPAAVFDVLRQRFQGLPEGGTELLTAVAVAGTASADDLAALTGDPVGRTLTLLDRAIAARLAADLGDGRVALAHSLLGEALRAATSSARLAHLHRAVADRLAARAGDDAEQAARIAGHRLAARSLDGGLGALPWLERASDHAVRVSALDQLRTTNEQILDVLSDAPALPDGSPEGSRRYRQELRARSRIAYADAWSGGFDSPTIREFCRLVRTWEATAPVEGGDVELLWVTTLFFCQLGRLDDADAAVGRMVAAAGALDEPAARFLAHDMSAVIRWMQGRFREALAHLDRAEDAASAGEDRSGRLDLRRSLAFSPPTRIAIVRAHCLWNLGDRSAALEQIDVALDAASAAGLGAAGFARRWALVLALMDGDPARVRALVTMQVSDPSWERFRYPGAIVQFAEGWLRAHEGDVASGLPAMRAAHAALLGQGLAAGRSVLLGLLAEVTLSAGDPAQAVALCDAGLAIAELGERFWVPRLECLRADALGYAAGGVSGPQAGGQSAGPG